MVGREDTLISEFTQKASLYEEEFSFEDTNAFSAFGLSFSGSNFIDADKYFQIEAYQLDNELRGPERRTNMTLHDCNDTDRKYFKDFDISIEDSLKPDNWTRLMCFDKPELLRFRKGIEGNKKNIVTKIEFKLCSNNSDCVPENLIKRVLAER